MNLQQFQHLKYQQKMLLKIAFGKEIHLYNGEISIGALKAFVGRSFKSVPCSFTFSYIDSDGDSIMVSTPQDIVMIESQSNGKVMKIYVQEDQRFDILPVQSRCFTFENHWETPTQEQVDNQMLTQISRDFLQSVGQKAITQVIQAEEKMMAEVTSKYLAELTAKVVSKAAAEQEKNMQERLSIRRRVSKMGRAKSAPRRSAVKKSTCTETQIQRKVQQKVRELIPSIIEKITKKIESKMVRTSCLKCDRTEISLEKLINKKLMDKYKLRQQKSLSKTRVENPEF